MSGRRSRNIHMTLWRSGFFLSAEEVVGAILRDAMGDNRAHNIRPLEGLPHGDAPTDLHRLDEED